ncbi:hypothetical protein BHE74_00036861 [Ensete ventricosum]|nr:hypothetical protein BHE74_00036861 [Ensete ventricosum]
MEARLRHNPWSFTSRFVAQERVLFYSTHLRCHSQVFYTECTIRKEHGGSSLVQPWTFYTKCMAREEREGSTLRLEEALMALSWMRQRCKVVEAWFPGLSLAHLGSDSIALKQGVYIHLEV